MSIAVTVDATPGGGLRLLPHIPDDRPCLLEGANGIGKTATIRLLQIATGTQPFGDDPAAWRALRDHLGPARVTFTGIDGDRVAEVSLTPHAWPGSPDDIGTWVGTATLDGLPIPINDLHARVEVVHFQGTERLRETLLARRSAYRRVLENVHQRLETLRTHRADLERIATAVAANDPERLTDLYARERSENQARARAAARGSELREREQQLVGVKGLAAIVSRAAAARNSSEARRHLEEVERLTARRAELETRIDDALQVLDAGDATQQSIVRLERRVQAAQRRATQHLKQYQALITQLGHDALPHHLPFDDDQRKDLEAVRWQLENSLRVAREEHQRASMTAAERQLHAELDGLLEDAEASGLGQFTIATVQSTAIDVHSLHRGMVHLRPTAAADPDVREFSDRIATLDKALRLESEYAREVEAAAAEAEAARTMRADNPQPHQEQLRLDQLREAAADVEAHLTAAAARYTEVAGGPIDEQTAAAAEERIAEILTGLSVERTDVDEALETTQHKLEETLQQHASAAQQLEIVAKDLADVARHRRTLRTALDGGRLSWLFPAVASADPTDDADAMRIGHRRIADAVRTLDALSNAVLGLKGAADGNQGNWNTVLNTAIEEHATAELSEAAVRDALFDGGSVRSVDMGRESITWERKDGTIVEQPFSTFSSGQQTLAYIRARLEQELANEHPNRIIFLDEFGAFLSAERREPLAELLRGPNLASLTSQIVVVLPLQSQYRRELNEVTGQLRLDYERRANAIDTRGYFTEVYRR